MNNCGIDNFRSVDLSLAVVTRVLEFRNLSSIRKHVDVSVITLEG